MEAEIIVRGEGQARALPDRVLVTATVESEGGSRDEAYSATAELAKQVDEVLARHDGAIDRASTAALVVHPKTRWRKGEAVRTGWQASRTTVLDVVDFARLGDLIAELAAAGAAISGESWRLDPTNPAHGEARRLAADDARRRAHEYAEALGLTVQAVTWVAEPGLRKGDSGGGWHPVARNIAYSPTAGGEDAEIIDVAPDEMVVSAAVEVGFTFT
jgi:uncharacterized protein